MRYVIVQAIALLVLTTGVAVAQETTSGSIAGQVVDAQGLAIPGATVTVSSSQGSQTFVTDNSGRFFAPFLTPGQYRVRVELQGFKSAERRDVSVSLGQRVELPFTLGVGGVSETVEVQGGSPTVDVSTTTVGATLDSALLQKVPIGRRFTDALYIAPGVSDSGGAGTANPSVSGASGLENEYIVDGVNTTNPGYGAVGSYSIVFGSLGTGVPFDFLKEVQVKTGGYDAEYGQATGGVVNVITKSGSNRVSGSLFGYTQPSGMEGTYTPVISTNGSRSQAVNITAAQQTDGGAEVGGPIIHDRLFYFGAVDPQWQRTTLIAPVNFPLRPLGEINRDRRLFAYAAKATWQPTTGNRLNFSVFGDPATGSSGPQRRAALLRADTSAFSSLDYGGNNQTLKYDGVLRSDWLLEGSISRAANNITETPSVNQWSVLDTTVTPNLRTGGIGFYEVGNDSRNVQLQAKSTNFIGNHQLRYGVEYRGHQLPEHHQPDRSDLHHARRQADGNRRRDQHPAGSHGRTDLPRHPGEPLERARHHAALPELLRAGHLALEPADGEAGHPLRTAEAHWQRVRFHMEQQLGAPRRRDLRPDGQRPHEAVRELGPLLREGAERPCGARPVG